MSRSISLRRLATGAVALGLVISACSSSETDDATPAASAATPEATVPAGAENPTDPSAAQTVTGNTSGGVADDAPAPTEAPVAVPDALQFTAPLVGGGEFDGATVADKPTVFWFWGPT